MKLPTLLIAGWLTATALAQNIHIQDTAFEGHHLVRQGQMYVLLTPFSQALGVQLAQAGEGYYATRTDEQAPSEVPAATLMVGSKQIKLLLESGDVFVPAEAYCQALGMKTRRDAGGGLRVETSVASQATAPVTARKSIPADPESYFVTQYPSRYNKTGNYKNANCGPTCMSMAALAYNVAPEGILPGDRQALILWCRQSMTLGLQNQNKGTTYHEMERVATQLGLTSKLLRKVEDMDEPLANGQLVVVFGESSQLGKGGSGGGHGILCVGRRGQDYLVNDPGGYFRTPGAQVSAAVIKKFFVGAIALYPGL